MTENKPIMIDGVNVSGCEYYGNRGSSGYWCHYYDEPCTNYPNCYYKKLKECDGIDCAWCTVANCPREA